MWRAMLAATGRCGREARGVEDAAPYGGKVPVLSLRDQSADWSWQSVTPVPFFHVFKWQFENTTIIHSSFFIFHFLPWRGKCGEQCSPLQAGADGRRGASRTPPPTGRCGRERRTAESRPYRRVIMFSNGNLKTPQFSILNFQLSILNYPSPSPPAVPPAPRRSAPGPGPFPGRRGSGRPPGPGGDRPRAGPGPPSCGGPGGICPR